MRLLIDVDGVLARFDAAYVELVNYLFKRNHTTEDVTEWAIERALGLSAEQTETVNSYIRTRGFASQLQPYPGAGEAVSRLRAVHDVYFVTSPFRGTRDQRLSWTADREHWLLDHFGVPHSKVVHTSAKHLCVGDVFIDDKPSNVSMWQEHHPSGFGLLWYQPYNWEHRGDLMVCHGWEHLDDLLRLLSPQYDGAPVAT